MRNINGTLKEQIEILNPDFVFCCGCFDNVRKILFNDKSKLESPPIFRDSNGAVYMDIYHPKYSSDEKYLGRIRRYNVIFDNTTK